MILNLLKLLPIIPRYSHSHVKIDQDRLMKSDTIP